MLNGHQWGVFGQVGWLKRLDTLVACGVPESDLLSCIDDGFFEAHCFKWAFWLIECVENDMDARFTQPKRAPV
jgi:hypothetical protein